MRLRTILLVLSLLAFLSASVGGFLFYATLRSDAITDAERRAVSRLAMIHKNIDAFLSENVKPVETLAGLKELRLRLIYRDDKKIQQQTNQILDHFQISLKTDVCYLMDQTGLTVASSNRNAKDSFVGKNFSFRPYFKQAFKTPPATYLALGTTSKRRGVYFSYPVHDEVNGHILGVAVIKTPIENIEKELGTMTGEMVMVTDPHGVIFISTRKDWLYHVLEPLSSHEKDKIGRSRQFGEGPWNWVGLTIHNNNSAIDKENQAYLFHQKDLIAYPGWKVLHLQNLKTIADSVSRPLIRIIGPVILALCFLIGTAVFFLYRRASSELIGRRNAEVALRESEERYRSLYHDTPAMLHSIDDKGKLISISDYWTEAMGYSREEVIGKPLTDFFTPESRIYAQKTVFPAFFNTGFCKDVPYRFIKKDGKVIDVLLSAVAVRDKKDKIIRSLAVSVDVTERKKAEEALRGAKEQLSRYSKDLERQVKERTREITSILKYTPDVVYIKDLQGCYLLINRRYEEIIGQSVDSIRGSKDIDIFPPETAALRMSNDQGVIDQGRPLQVEEQFQHSDELHVYLSVKFPLYDESGAITGMCNISTDITAEKKARDQLRRLSAGVMADHEAERAAIARELHDELGQVLTALRMDSAWMADRLKQTDYEASLRAGAMRDLIDKNIEDVRGLAIRLRPGILDDLGLVDALEWLTTDFEKRTEITSVFEHESVPTLINTVSTAIYRITQEALTNVGRHAGADHVTVRFLKNNRHLTLAVFDDGQGFSMESLAQAEGLGIVGMQERASLVGGTLKVTSAPGQGTRIDLTIPLSEQEDNPL